MINGNPAKSIVEGPSGLSAPITSKNAIIALADSAGALAGPLQSGAP
jgi:hypothetical protein